MLKRVTFLVFSFTIAVLTAQSKLSLDAIYQDTIFKPKGIQSVVPVGDGRHFCILENRTKLVRYTYNRDSAEVLIDLSGIRILDGVETDKIDGFSMNSTGTHVLLAFDSEPIYRRSSLVNYVIWDLRTGKGAKLSKKGKQQEASFSPNGQKIAFIRENNLYVTDLSTNKETQVTPDGIYNHIINGHADWVYEEEFGLTKAYTWSPNSDQIAFLKFDESRVSDYSMTYWEGLYPKQKTFKYPKAGHQNSIISAHVYNVETRQSSTLKIGEDADVYYPRIFFSPMNDEVVIYRLNRLQNELNILLCNTKGMGSKLIYKETNPAYIDIADDFYFFKNGKQFLISSEKDGYNHFYLYSTEGKQIRQITQGKWDVNKLYGVDEGTQKIFFQASYSAPYNAEVLSVGLNGKNLTVLNKNQGEGSTDALFSPNYDYVLYTYSHANIPPVYSLYSIDSKGTEQLISVLEDNKALVAQYKEFGFVDKTIENFITDSGQMLYYWMMKPAQMDSQKKYPLLMFVYGGPSSKEVRNQFGRTDYLWYQMLVQQGYIVVCVDNRGTGGRGADFKRSTYLNLGKYEVEDQIASAHYFGKFSYIDPSRIGIWGWSYGGFMSANCLFRAPEVFKMGVAVAPVSYWGYYDNIYTERYMRRPYDNPLGYNTHAPIHYVDGLQGAFLMIHGTADDNVHYQQSLELAGALQNAGKQFEMHFYPNKNHSLLGDKTREHLYKKITNFIYDNL